MGNPLTRDARGYESQFATDTSGTFSSQLWALCAPIGGASAADGLVV
jgi:hypothetical protein